MLRSCLRCFGPGEPPPAIDATADNQMALDRLKQAPEEFLADHVVSCTELIKATGSIDFWFGAVKSKAYKLQKSAGWFQDGPAPIQISVFAVRTSQLGEVEVGALPPQQIEARCELICTAKLTGCCLVIQPYDPFTGEGPYLVHIQPPEGTPGEDLEDDLKGRARFDGCDAPPICFGSQDYNPLAEEASVIGVVHEGVWTLWAQIIDKSTYSILRVRPIGR